MIATLECESGVNWIKYATFELASKGKMYNYGRLLWRNSSSLNVQFSNNLITIPWCENGRSDKWEMFMTKNVFVKEVLWLRSGKFQAVDMTDNKRKELLHILSFSQAASSDYAAVQLLSINNKCFSRLCGLEFLKGSEAVHALIYSIVYM